MRRPAPRSIMLHLPLAAVLFVAPAGEAPAAPRGADAVLALLDSRGQTEALLAALGVSGLRGPLAEMGDLTVLAPTDEAFGRIPTREVTRLFDEGSRGRLQRILSAHVIPGALDAAALLERGQVTTVGGVTLDVELAGGQLLIGGAAVSTNDLRCEGGVVHELAAVIDPAPRPPTPSSASRAARSTSVRGSTPPVRRRSSSSPSSRRASSGARSSPCARGPGSRPAPPPSARRSPVSSPGAPNPP